MTTVEITSLYEDKTIIAITPALRKSFGLQNLLPTGDFLDLFDSVLADWNDLSPTTKKLPLRDFKNVLRKTFK